MLTSYNGIKMTKYQICTVYLKFYFWSTSVIEILAKIVSKRVSDK